MIIESSSITIKLQNKIYHLVGYLMISRNAMSLLSTSASVYSCYLSSIIFSIICLGDSGVAGDEADPSRCGKEERDRQTDRDKERDGEREID